MDGSYWSTFWKRSGRDSRGEASQSRVMRTENRVPISEERWRSTVDYVTHRLQLGEDARVLDLCAGTGLFTEEFARRGASVCAVDVSSDLLAAIDTAAFPRVETRCQDMRELAFPEQSFSHVFLYAGIQYLSHAEAIVLIRRCYEWLSAGGVLMIGDVPDLELRWCFYNSAERRAAYFENAAEGLDVIGTWFERRWMEYLGETIGFSSIDSCDQPADQIYAHYRFDAFLTK